MEKATLGTRKRDCIREVVPLCLHVYSGRLKEEKLEMRGLSGELSAPFFLGYFRARISLYTDSWMYVLNA